MMDGWIDGIDEGKTNKLLGKYIFGDFFFCSFMSIQIVGCSFNIDHYHLAGSVSFD
jgi:hypothetical protein